MQDDGKRMLKKVEASVRGCSGCVAVVKISATGLPTLALGDSDKLQVGDYVNPDHGSDVWLRKEALGRALDAAADSKTRN